ncbi:MAG TPA: nucleotidyltransferase family protein [Dissulfurispiraceae bacterium]|nr:nucleotidyltransferase family protein [Dissulfurispiraceae bacterium]
MPVGQDLAAVILSAGASSRMAEFKPLLPLGNSTVIETAIGTFKQAGIPDITVVVGHRADDLKAVLDRVDGVRCVTNEKYREGMFSSVIAGIRSLRSGIKAVFILPADIPLVRSDTIELIAETYCRRRPRIFYPTYKKKRGHPPLIPAQLFPEILSWTGVGGLQSLLERHDAESMEIEVRDEGILLDLDTPEDYESACKAYGHGGKR